ncbi:hypothetical protein UG55_102260 [Frankia sp. EI5c]|nr:hypothetical protein UG55_102260 [Frankia sp. EI5c]
MGSRSGGQDVSAWTGEEPVGEHQRRSPWARPAGGESAAAAEAAVRDRGLESWRAAAAATADPRWARHGGEPGEPGEPTGAGARLRWSHPWEPWDPRALPGTERRGEPGGGPGSDALPAGGRPTAAADTSAAPAAEATTRPGGAGAAIGRARRVLAIACPPLVVLAGGAAVIGSTMTWATVRAFGLMEFAVRGTDPDQHGHLTMLLGILAMVAGLLLAGRRVEWGRMLAVVAGLMLVLTAVVDVARVRRGGLLTGAGFDATTALGPGLWVIGVSGVVLVVVGALARPSPGPRRRDAPSR